MRKSRLGKFRGKYAAIDGREGRGQMVDRRLYSELEACEQLGICRKTLKDHVRAGDIRYVLIGKHIRK